MGYRSVLIGFPSFWNLHAEKGMYEGSVRRVPMVWDVLTVVPSWGNWVLLELFLHSIHSSLSSRIVLGVKNLQQTLQM